MRSRHIHSFRVHVVKARFESRTSHLSFVPLTAVHKCRVKELELYSEGGEVSWEAE